VNALSPKIKIPPICPYCEKTAKLVDSNLIYKPTQDFFNKFKPFNGVIMMWACEDYPKCDAYVGCHPKSTIPLGTLANAELRTWRKKSKSPFERLWKEGHIHNFYPQISKDEYRSYAYIWLSKKLELDPDLTHFGMFDLSTCMKVYELFKEELPQLLGIIVLEQGDDNPLNELTISRSNSRLISASSLIQSGKRDQIQSKKILERIDIVL
jgi:Protein of unknown function (DUF3268).